MFEEQKRKSLSHYIAMVVLVIVILISFSIGYFLNNSPDESISKNKASEKTHYTIPEDVKRPTVTAVPQENTGILAEEVSAASTDDRLGGDMVLSFKTHYALCGHVSEKHVKIPDQLVGASKDALMRNYPDWQIVSFTDHQTILKKDLPNLCPDHYVIGTLDGYVAIFTFNETGEKILKEQTDIPLSTLTPEDQSNLENGIIADTEEDLEQKLDGLSN